MHRQEAKDQFQPGYFFQKASIMYSDRQLVLLFLMFSSVIVSIYAHFSITKFQSQIDNVPPDASHYWMKVVVPAFEFGTMHAILLMLALIPLTMCRFTIAHASNTFLNNILPFRDMVSCHIFLGYAVVFLLFITTVVFVIFFGFLCGEGDQTFCTKLTSEIMITGYILFASFLTIGVTSYLRHVIPYRVFYIVHHLFIIAYAVTIAHTVDTVQRKQGGRSQTFKWFSLSLIIYIADRIALYLTNRFQTHAIQSNVITSSVDHKKMLHLRLRKPRLFHFKPGQYVYLRIPDVNRHWHPFSIASSPDSEHLDFYIKSFGETSWSARLWGLMKERENNLFQKGSITANDDHSFPRVAVEIMGPYGTSLGRIKNYSHGLLVGTGTGVVPLMSLLQRHVDQVLSLHPEIYSENIRKHRITRIELYNSRLNQNGTISSFMKKKFMACIYNSKAEKISFDEIELVRNSSPNLYKFIAILPSPAFGLLMVGLTLAWNNLSFAPYEVMVSILSYGSVCFQVYFLTVTVFMQTSSLWICIDLIFFALSVVGDCFWYKHNLWGNFDLEFMMYYSIMTLYMVVRLWITVVNMTYNPIVDSNKRRSDLVVLEKVKLIWITQSASLVGQIYPDLEVIWSKLCSAWGAERARRVCEISIYCTDKNGIANMRLRDSIISCNLLQEDEIHFGRPNIQQLLAQQSKELIDDTNLNVSHTLFAFCGSSKLASNIKRAKLLNDTIIGHTQHHMDLAIECYGGLNKTKSDDSGNKKSVESKNILKMLSRALHIENCYFWKRELTDGSTTENTSMNSIHASKEEEDITLNSCQLNNMQSRSIPSNITNKESTDAPHIIAKEQTTSGKDASSSTEELEGSHTLCLTFCR